MNTMALRAAAALLAIAALGTTANAAEPSLTAGQWSVVEMDGKRVRTPASINFTRVRWLGINTACGPLSGWYRQSGAALRMHITRSGRWQVGRGSPCQGIDYQLLLGRVRSFAAEGDRLVFMGEDGKAVARLARKK